VSGSISDCLKLARSVGVADCALALVKPKPSDENMKSDFHYAQPVCTGYNLHVIEPEGERLCQKKPPASRYAKKPHFNLQM
jgi:hypothetical protein